MIFSIADTHFRVVIFLGGTDRAGTSGGGVESISVGHVGVPRKRLEGRAAAGFGLVLDDVVAIVPDRDLKKRAPGCDAVANITDIARVGDLSVRSGHER